MLPLDLQKILVSFIPHKALANHILPRMIHPNVNKERASIINNCNTIEDPFMRDVKQSYFNLFVELYECINIENHDTIGLLAIDKKGDISGACTTSGLSWKLHGRVGDSPVIGAGMYVDNEVGGCCATGVGEAVLKTLGSFLVVELMRQGATPQEACEEAIARIVKTQNYKDMQIGYLVINKKGEHGAYAVHPGFNYALHQNGSNTLIDSESHTKK